MLGRQLYALNDLSSRNGYPVEFEMKLEKENSQPAHGYGISIFNQYVRLNMLMEDLLLKVFWLINRKTYQFYRYG